MNHFQTWAAPSALVFSLLMPASLGAQADEAKAVAKAATSQSPILDALRSVDEDTRKFNEHIVMLSSPFMEGRVPGSRGMEIAKEYVEFWFKKYGLKPAFDHGQQMSFRQPFPLSSTPTVVGSRMQVPGVELVADRDFAGHQCEGGKVSGKLVSVGYSIRAGRGGYNSYDDDPDLKGKVALVLRGTPMGDGEKRWRQSRRYSLQAKVFQALRSGAAGVIVVAPSFVEGDELAKARHRRVKIPVLGMTREAADKMLKAVGSDQTVASLAAANDKEGKTQELGDKPIECEVMVKVKTLNAENVGGLLVGKGALAKELIVVGGHLDHLGMGNFGSRSAKRGQVVHAGADDNASGSIAVMMIAEKMAAAYAKMPAGQPARSVLFVGFSAEESGLNGSKYCADNMIPDHKCVLMINFDMIGRVRNNKVSVMGTGTAKGMNEWVSKLCDQSSLDVRVVPGAMGGSDHLNFLRKGIPVLMGHSGQHSDYHTERDVADKINRVGAAQTTQLFAEIGLAAAVWDATYEFQSTNRRR